MDILLSFVGLMRRAGACTLGSDASFDACRANKARLLVLASDASANTQKAAKQVAEECGMFCLTLPFTKLDLGHGLGIATCAVLAVTNTGFAIALCEKTGFSQPLEQLLRRKRREDKKHKPAAATSAERGNKYDRKN